MKVVISVLAFVSLTTFADEPKGGIDKGAIQETINRAMPMYRECYEKEAKKSEPGPSGQVNTKIVIAADGKVNKAEVKSSSLGNASIESCLLEALKGLIFPAPEGGGTVEVDYPFSFNQKAKEEKGAEKAAPAKKKKH